MFLVGNGDDHDANDDANNGFDKEKVKASLQMVGYTAHHQKSGFQFEGADFFETTQDSTEPNVWLISD